MLPKGVCFSSLFSHIGTQNNYNYRYYIDVLYRELKISLQKAEEYEEIVAHGLVICIRPDSPEDQLFRRVVLVNQSTTDHYDNWPNN